MSTPNTRLPVTVVTGFLGSGKTTLLARLLREVEVGEVAVLVNEVGQEGLDHHLLQQVEEETVLVGGGCLCCIRREDLVAALRALLARRERGELALERVVVETSGLADPAPILYTVETDPVLQHHVAIDRVIATADAVNGELHLDLHPESVQQATAAHTILITKSDLAEPGAVEALRSRLRRLNPLAEILVGRLSAGDLATLVGPPARPERLLGGPVAGEAGSTAPGTDGHSGVRSVSLVLDRPLDWTVFGLWMSMLLYAHGRQVLRVKGLLDTGEPGPVSVNGVQHVVHAPEHLPSWPTGTGVDRRSRIVFIVRDLDPRRIIPSLEAFQGALGEEPAT